MKAAARIAGLALLAIGGKAPSAASTAVGLATSPEVADTSAASPPDAVAGTVPDLARAAGEAVAVDVPAPTDAPSSGADTVTGDAVTDTGEVWGWKACAKELISDLPLAGSPCMVHGQRRCTNQGAHIGGFMADNDLGETCYRHNYLVCTLNSDGALGWALKSCLDEFNVNASAMQRKSCQPTVNCVDSGTDGKCVPIKTDLSVSGGGTLVARCRKDVAGQAYCMGSVAECQPFKNGMFHSQLPGPQIPLGKDPLGVCGAFAEGGSYWVPIYNCQFNAFKNCPKQGKMTSAWCDNSNGEYRCSKTCQEALATLAKKQPDPPP